MWIRRNGRRLAAAIAAWFFSLTLFGKIAVSVIAIHLALLFIMGIDHLASPSPKQRNPLTVRIHQPVKEKLKPISVTSVSKPKKAAPSPKKKSATPKKSKLPDLSALRELEKSFAAISTAALESSTASKLNLPSFLESSSVEAKVDETASASYGPYLVTFFQKHLQLPEIGDVKARITLKAPGQLLSLEILDTKSSKNADWLKNQLPLLELPCFNDFGITDANLEFTITFRNVEKI